MPASIAVDELANGGYLIETRSDVGDWFKYRTSSGVIITEVVIRELVKFGALAPCNDGLFGDSQSYKLGDQKQTFDQFCRSLWGRDWVLARKGSKAALGHARSVKKSEMDLAKKIFPICERAWQAA